MDAASAAHGLLLRIFGAVLVSEALAGRMITSSSRKVQIALKRSDVELLVGFQRITC